MSELCIHRSKIILYIIRFTTLKLDKYLNIIHFPFFANSSFDPPTNVNVINSTSYNFNNIPLLLLSQYQLIKLLLPLQS